MNEQYKWAEFYNEFATEILQYKTNRSDLINKVLKVFENIDVKLPKLEKDNNIIDMDPFTVVGLCNRNHSKENRIKIANSIKNIFNIQSEIPTNFDGIPILPSTSAAFYSFVDDREDGDIDCLWNVFEAALLFEQYKNDDYKNRLNDCFNLALKVKGVGITKLTMGLFWILPHTFFSLDNTNKVFITKSEIFEDEIVECISNDNTIINFNDYFNFVGTVSNYLKNENCNIKDFIELSTKAYEFVSTLSKGTNDPDGFPDGSINKVKYWVYAPGVNASKWDEYRTHGIMGFNWAELGDLNQYNSLTEIKEVMKETYSGTTSFSNSAKGVWQFVNEIKPGDIIFAKKGTDKIVGRGIVESQYFYDTEFDEESPNCIKVNWTHSGVYDYPGNAPIKSLTDISQYTDLVNQLNELFKTEEVQDDIEIEDEFEKYTKEDFLKQVYIDNGEYETLTQLLNIKKNIILQGAPGVGKTFMAKRLAYSIMGVMDFNRVMMIQFHQSYTYEDFIEGFRPVTNGDGFEIKKGSFYNFCKKAEEDKENDYFFIIDEINRGNLSKIFGELFMLIEKDKRDYELQLLYSDEKFCVPSNVFIIGTMNTADRSLALLDYALRRRFAFYDMKPSFETNGFKEYQEKLHDDRFDRLINCIKLLNTEILKDDSLGDGFCIGHSYFCELKAIDEKLLKNIVEYEIIPLLKEYWYDEMGKVDNWSEKLRSAIK